MKQIESAGIWVPSMTDRGILRPRAIARREMHDDEPTLLRAPAGSGHALRGIARVRAEAARTAAVVQMPPYPIRQTRGARPAWSSRAVGLPAMLLLLVLGFIAGVEATLLGCALFAEAVALSERRRTATSRALVLVADRRTTHEAVGIPLPRSRH